MKNKKIVFFGTPNFAKVVLQGLIDNGYNVIAVVTQPDKEVGRKRILTPTPTKELALSYNIPVYQPIKLRLDYEFLKDLDFDMIITAAYGQIIPTDVLNMSKINNINVHGSLLPKYRGGAPIQRSIINGDKETGVTIMEMVDKMDAGKMYAKASLVIDDEINNDELFDKLAILGKDLLLSVLPDLLENKLEGEVQNEEEVTFAFNIKREEEKIDFNKKVVDVHNLIRGLANNPGAYCLFKDKEMKIYKAKVFNEDNLDLPVGTLILEGKNRLLVRCNNGYLELLTIKVEGKSLMDVKSFLNGVNKEELVKEMLK